MKIRKVCFFIGIQCFFLLLGRCLYFLCGDQCHVLSLAPNQQKNQKITIKLNSSSFITMKTKKKREMNKTAEQIIVPESVPQRGFVNMLVQRSIKKIQSLVTSTKVRNDCIYLVTHALLVPEQTKVTLMFVDFGFTFRVLVYRKTREAVCYSINDVTMPSIISVIQKHTGGAISESLNVTAVLQQAVVLTNVDHGVRHHILLVPLAKKAYRKAIIAEYSKRRPVQFRQLAVDPSLSAVVSTTNTYLKKKRVVMQSKLIALLVTLSSIIGAVMWRFRSTFGINTPIQAITDGLNMIAAYLK